MFAWIWHLHNNYSKGYLQPKSPGCCIESLPQYLAAPAPLCALPVERYSQVWEGWGMELQDEVRRPLNLAELWLHQFPTQKKIKTVISSP